MHGKLAIDGIRLLLDIRLCAWDGHCAKYTKKLSKFYISNAFFLLNVLCFPNICNILENGERARKSPKK